MQVSIASQVSIPAAPTFDITMDDASLMDGAQPDREFSRYRDNKLFVEPVARSSHLSSY